MTRPLVLVSLLALAACSGAQEDSAADPVALVTLATARGGSVVQTATLFGAVESGGEALFTLAAPAEAIVARIAAPVGTPVARGQLVVELRPSPATRAELAGAEADLTAAEQALARAQRLRADGLASDADVESARQAAANARSMRQSSAGRNGALALRAPGPGVVQSIAAGPGDLVAAGTAVATVSRAGGALRARFGIDPASARRLAPGMALRVAPADGRAPFGAAILSVDPVSDPQTRLASVTVRIPASLGLGAGQPLTAEAPLRQDGETVTIPYAALLDDGGQPYVFVVAKGVARRRDLVTGATDGKSVAVTRGLAPGDAVVVEGGTAVEDGLKVRTK
jgi:RND family efflux transporter MFP subunit